MLSKGAGWRLSALNSRPSRKVMLLAVVAKNDPPIFKDAFSPKIMPAGLRRNKLAVPLAWRVP